MDIKIETSARHIHLTADDFKTLFGTSESHVLKEIGQNQVACEETVAIKGIKSDISNVRLIGPFREKSQLEISRTDCFSLGIDAPLKISGDLPGAKVLVSGPAGSIEKDITIVAKRHLHLPTMEADKLNLKNGSTLSVEVLGERALRFDGVIVRVDDQFTPSVHIDTDEANAAGISVDAVGKLILNSKV